MEKVKEILQTKQKAQELYYELDGICSTYLSDCQCSEEAKSNIEWAMEVIEELTNTLWD